MKLTEHKKLSDPSGAKSEALKHDLAYQVAKLIEEARIMKGITQKQIAQMMGSTQPSIARVEGGSVLPSLTFLDKMAKSLGTYVIVSFAFMSGDVGSKNESGSVHINTSGHMVPSVSLKRDHVVRV